MLYFHNLLSLLCHVRMSFISRLNRWKFSIFLWSWLKPNLINSWFLLHLCVVSSYLYIYVNCKGKMEYNLLIIILALSAFCGNAIHFKVPVNTEKCLKEEIHKDVLVKGEFEITSMAGVKVDLLVRLFWIFMTIFQKYTFTPILLVCIQVTDSNSHILYQKEEAAEGKFAFTTDDYDMFQICFKSKSEVKG